MAMPANFAIATCELCDEAETSALLNITPPTRPRASIRARLKLSKSDTMAMETIAAISLCSHHHYSAVTIRWLSILPQSYSRMWETLRWRVEFLLFSRD